MLTITFRDERLELHPDRALWWPAERALVVADLHLGKGAVFRARGLPLPGGASQRDLQRLAALVERLAPSRLIVVGDLVHGAESEAALELLCEWRQRHRSVELQLVAGNHDRHVCDQALGRAIEVQRALRVRGLRLAHAPDDEIRADSTPREPTIAGHLHPGVFLDDFDRSGVTVPAFIVDQRQLILPAFGSLTGCRAVPAARGRRRFAAAAGRVVEVP